MLTVPQDELRSALLAGGGKFYIQADLWHSQERGQFKHGRDAANTGYIQVTPLEFAPGKWSFTKVGSYTQGPLVGIPAYREFVQYMQ